MGLFSFCARMFGQGKAFGRAQSVRWSIQTMIWDLVKIIFCFLGAAKMAEERVILQLRLGWIRARYDDVHGMEGWKKQHDNSQRGWFRTNLE